MTMNQTKQHRYDYADEKLKAVYQNLATGEGDVRSRLVSNFGVLTRIRPQDLPPDLAHQLSEILALMTFEPPLRRPDGTVLRTSVEQTMRRRINRTAARIAKKIVDLKGDLDRFHEKDEI
jgi:hypothetical protein